jgi:hypothetical protein
MEPCEAKFDCLLDRGVLLINARMMRLHMCSRMLTDSKMQVTWVEHSEYDESAVHRLYRHILNSGMGFGAQRWIAALQRHYECMAMLLSPTILGEDQTGLGMLLYPSFTCLFSPKILYVSFAELVLSCYSDKSGR